MKLARFSICALLALLASSTASADKEQARKLYGDAQKSYDLGKFSEAATLFEQGYAEHADPVFLYNLGQCHRQLGNNDRALFFYRGYLRNKPDAANREQVEQLIADLEKARQTQTQTPIAPIPPGGTPPPEPRAPAATPSPAAVPPPAEPAPEAVAESSASPPDEPSAAQTEAEVSMPSGGPSRNTQKYLAWGTVGVGAVMIGVGVMFGLKSKSAKSDIENASEESPLTLDEYNSKYDDGKSSAQKATIFLGVGSLAVIGGGVWAYFASKPAPVESAGLQVDLSDGLRVAYAKNF